MGFVALPPASEGAGPPLEEVPWRRSPGPQAASGVGLGSHAECVQQAAWKDRKNANVQPPPREARAQGQGRGLGGCIFMKCLPQPGDLGTPL